MTVSYGGANLGERPVEPLRWSAREFMLIDSHSGAHVHEVLARWPLRAASACAAG
jgi:2'-5' RNA ligase